MERGRDALDESGGSTLGDAAAPGGRVSLADPQHPTPHSLRARAAQRLNRAPHQVVASGRRRDQLRKPRCGVVNGLPENRAAAPTASALRQRLPRPQHQRLSRPGRPLPAGGGRRRWDATKSPRSGRKARAPISRRRPGAASRVSIAPEPQRRMHTPPSQLAATRSPSGESATDTASSISHVTMWTGCVPPFESRPDSS
jgi:hypothetical protein